ncbi:MAG: phosphonate ABC transporter, permease protein PhnE [Erysipelotrichaceae bacterium]
MTNNKLTVEKQYELRPKTWIRVVASLIVLVAVLYPSFETLNFTGISSNGMVVAKNMIKGILSPSISYVFDTSTSGLAYLLLETAAIGFLGTIIGAIISVPLAFMSSRNLTPKAVSYLGVAIATILRTFPVFVYGVMFIKVTGPGAFAGVLTLAATSIGMCSKLFIEAIEDLDPGITEALDATGCTTFQKIRFGIIPQLLSNFISIVIYRYDINVKNASVLGLVGAGGIGAPLKFAMSGGRWSDVGVLLLGLIVLVLVIEYFSTAIRNKLITGE